MLLPFPVFSLPRGQQDVTRYLNHLQFWPHVQSLVAKYLADIADYYPEFNRVWFEAAVDLVSKFLVSANPRDLSGDRLASHLAWLSEPVPSWDHYLSARYEQAYSLHPELEAPACSADVAFKGQVEAWGYRTGKRQHQVMLDLLSLVWLACLEPETPDG